MLKYRSNTRLPDYCGCLKLVVCKSLLKVIWHIIPQPVVKIWKHVPCKKSDNELNSLIWTSDTFLVEHIMAPYMVTFWILLLYIFRDINPPQNIFLTWIHQKSVQVHLKNHHHYKCSKLQDHWVSQSTAQNRFIYLVFIWLVSIIANIINLISNIPVCLASIAYLLNLHASVYFKMEPQCLWKW